MLFACALQRSRVFAGGGHAQRVLYAGDRDASVFVNNDFRSGKEVEIARGVRGREEMKLLVFRSEEVVVHVMGMLVAACYKHVGVAEDGRIQGHPVHLFEGVTGKNDDGECRGMNSGDQAEEGLRLLKRFAAGKGDALDLLLARQDFPDGFFDRCFVAAFGIMRRGIEASRTVQSTALEPKHSSQSRAVGTAGGFKGM